MPAEMTAAMTLCCIRRGMQRSQPIVDALLVCIGVIASFFHQTACWHFNIVFEAMVGFAESLVALKREQETAPPPPPTPTRSAVLPRDLSAVYIADEAYAWLPANVVKTDGDKVTVCVALPKTWHSTTILSPDSTIDDLEDAALSDSSETELEEGAALRVVNLNDYPRNELPLQNSQRSIGKRDMADLPFLHEAAILYNLKQRHADEQPYTRVGEIIVAMNPFKWMNELYSQETRDLYAKSLVWEGTLCWLYGCCACSRVRFAYPM